MASIVQGVGMEDRGMQHSKKPFPKLHQNFTWHPRGHRPCSAGGLRGPAHPRGPTTEDDRGVRAGEGTYPQCSPHSMVPLEGGAPLLLFPTAAKLCPLQLLLQLGNLAAGRGREDRQVKQSKSALGPPSQA